MNYDNPIEIQSEFAASDGGSIGFAFTDVNAREFSVVDFLATLDTYEASGLIQEIMNLIEVDPSCRSSKLR